MPLRGLCVQPTDLMPTKTRKPRKGIFLLYQSEKKEPFYRQSCPINISQNWKSTYDVDDIDHVDGVDDVDVQTGTPVELVV